MLRMDCIVGLFLLMFVSLAAASDTPLCHADVTRTSVTVRASGRWADVQYQLGYVMSLCSDSTGASGSGTMVAVVNGVTQRQGGMRGALVFPGNATIDYALERPQSLGSQYFNLNISYGGNDALRGVLCSAMYAGEYGACVVDSIIPVLIVVLWLLPALGCAAFLVVAYMRKNQYDREKLLKQREENLKTGWQSPTTIRHAHGTTAHLDASPRLGTSGISGGGGEDADGNEEEYQIPSPLSFTNKCHHDQFEESSDARVAAERRAQQMELYISQEAERARIQQEELAAKERQEADDRARNETMRAQQRLDDAEKVQIERQQKQRVEAALTEKNREAERAKAERLETVRREAERLENERLEAERLEAERLEAERAKAERLETVRREAERLENERLKAERLEKERLEADAQQQKNEEELLAASVSYNAKYQQLMMQMQRPDVSERPRPFLGFSLAESVEDRNLVVDGVYHDGPAYQVGVRIDDELTGIAGDAVSSIQEARKLVARHCRPAMLSNLTFRRPNGETYTVKLWVMTSEPRYRGKPYFFDTDMHEKQQQPPRSSRARGVSLRSFVAAQS